MLFFQIREQYKIKTKYHISAYNSCTIELFISTNIILFWSFIVHKTVLNNYLYKSELNDCWFGTFVKAKIVNDKIQRKFHIFNEIERTKKQYIKTGLN